MMKRGLFIIYNNEVKIVFHDTMDHREWIESLGLDLSNFDSIVRGYIIDNKIVFFKGSMFNYDNEVYEAARIYGPRIRSMVNNDSLIVCCGIVVASAGSKWEPVVTLKESDLIKDIITITDKSSTKVNPFLICHLPINCHSIYYNYHYPFQL